MVMASASQVWSLMPVEPLMPFNESYGRGNLVKDHGRIQRSVTQTKCRMSDDSVCSARSSRRVTQLRNLPIGHQSCRTRKFLSCGEAGGKFLGQDIRGCFWGNKGVYPEGLPSGKGTSKCHGRRTMVASNAYDQTNSGGSHNHSNHSHSRHTSSLCIFPLADMCTPTSSGVLQIFEPRYLDMFEVILHVAQAGRATPKFGCLFNLSTFFTDDSSWQQAYVPAGVDMDALGGGIGCCCQVDSVTALQDGTLLVRYTATRRFHVLSRQRSEPFQVAAVEWLEDTPPDKAGAYSGVHLDVLEHNTWQALKEVASLTAILDASSAHEDASSTHGSADIADPSHPGKPPQQELRKDEELLALERLPAGVLQYAPVDVANHASRPPSQRAEANIAVWKKMHAGARAHADAHGGGRGEGKGKGALHAATREGGGGGADDGANPYWAAREKLAKGARQEMFSFAAASTVDASPEEKLALLAIRSTGRRLDWVLEAVRPHLAVLRAKHALLQAGR
eukprot:jgi/Mesen1/3551/ME000199S02702